MGRYLTILVQYTTGVENSHVMKSLFLWFAILCSSRAQEITDEQIKALHKPTGLALKESYRCGLFFPNPDSTDLSKLLPKPVAPLFIFNATWEAPECLDGKPDIDRYKKFCKSIWEKIMKKLKLKLETPSLRKEAEKGETIGDDICQHLDKKVKARFVGIPGLTKQKFPNGLEWGMYANGCGEVDWHYSGIKHTEKVCCKGRPTPKKPHRNVPCISP